MKDILKNIKAILVELASNDELPLDMNDLDESVFERALDEESLVRVLTDKGYTVDICKTFKPEE